MTFGQIVAIIVMSVIAGTALNHVANSLHPPHTYQQQVDCSQIRKVP